MSSIQFLHHITVEVIIVFEFKVTFHFLPVYLAWHLPFAFLIVRMRFDMIQFELVNEVGLKVYLEGDTSKFTYHIVELKVFEVVEQGELK